jgi:hypothetical protein
MLVKQYWQGNTISTSPSRRKNQEPPGPRPPPTPVWFLSRRIGSFGRELFEDHKAQ